MRIRLITFSTIVLAASVYPTCVGAQATRTPNRMNTSPIANARYEVILSEVDGGRTLRLDRFTGRISQLIVAKDSSAAWEDMEVRGTQPSSTQLLPRFQLITSGPEPRRTILIDVHTGWSWHLIRTNVRGKDGAIRNDFAWQSMPI